MGISYRIIGQNIKKARKANHLTQEQVAQIIHLSVLHYGRLERGERPISLNQLSKTATALNTTIESLLVGCCLKDHPVFEAAADSPAGTAEYALFLLDEYREQIREYYHTLKLKESALR